MLMYRFLESLKTNGNNRINVATMIRKDSSTDVLKNTNETIKAAIPTATFKP
jgi:hypothetical protein